MERKIEYEINRLENMFILCDLWGTILLDDDSSKIIETKRAIALHEIFCSKGLNCNTIDCYKLLENERSCFKKSEMKGIVQTSIQRLNNLTLGYLNKEDINLLKQIFSNIALNFLPLVNQDLTSVLIQAKKRNNKIAILSNTGLIDSQTTYAILDKLNLMQFFDYCFLSEEIGLCKPDKKFFQYATKKMNATKENIVYIGDNYKMDYLPAIKLGYTTFLYD